MRPTQATIILILMMGMILFPYAYALPTTQDVAFKNSSAVLFYATGCACPCWYKYGTLTGNYPWTTANQSNVSALNYIWEKGTPLMSSTKFYYRACDSTGCGGEKFVTLDAVTPAPTTTFGVVAQNISRSHFDLATLGANIIEPTLWTLPNAEVLFGLVLFFVFTGYVIRQREAIMPLILGMICAGLLIYSGTNSVGMPPEFVIIIVGIAAVILTGVVFGFFKR